MIEKVESYIKKNGLLYKNETVVLAYSTGVDSVVLLDILIKLGYKVVIAHVNHNFREESKTEELYTRNFCLKHDLDLEIYNFHHDSKTNFEAKAHEARYKFFKQVAKKYHSKTIITAHHKNDNLESILLKLFKGSNLYGYSGIVPNVVYQNYHIVRPLLSLDKNEIYQYAKDNDLTYFEDKTNTCLTYKRNSIRHNLIPIMTEECPKLLDKSLQFSERLLEAFNYLRKNSEAYLKENNNNINIQTFNNLDKALKKDIITKLLESYNIDFSSSLINDILNIINNNAPQLDYNLKNNFILKKRYQLITIGKEEKKNYFETKLTNVNDRIDTKEFSLFFSKNKPLDNEKYIILCYNTIEWPLVVRNKKNGDKIIMSYGKKKLKDLFINKKILREARNKALLVTDNSENILWVVGIAKSSLIKNCKNNGDIYLTWRSNK